jgi:two-component system NtrC family response regulator
MKPKLLIVDDDEEIRTQMKWALTHDYEVFLAEDRATAMAVFREQHPMLALLDLGLPPSPASPDEGFAALSEMLSLNAHAKIIIISGQGERSKHFHAIGLGLTIS